VGPHQVPYQVPSGKHGQLSPAPINSDSDSPGFPAEWNTGPESHSANNNLLDFYFYGHVLAQLLLQHRRVGVFFKNITMTDIYPHRRIGSKRNRKQRYAKKVQHIFLPQTKTTLCVFLLYKHDSGAPIKRNLTDRLWWCCMCRNSPSCPYWVARFSAPQPSVQIHLADIIKSRLFRLEKRGIHLKKCFLSNSNFTKLIVNFIAVSI